MYDDNEVMFIRHRYKVMTLLISERKLNNTNITEKPQKMKKNSIQIWK